MKLDVTTRFVDKEMYLVCCDVGTHRSSESAAQDLAEYMASNPAYAGRKFYVCAVLFEVEGGKDAETEDAG